MLNVSKISAYLIIIIIIIKIKLDGHFLPRWPTLLRWCRCLWLWCRAAASWPGLAEGWRGGATTDALWREPNSRLIASTAAMSASRAATPSSSSRRRRRPVMSSRVTWSRCRLVRPAASCPSWIHRCLLPGDVKISRNYGNFSSWLSLKISWHFGNMSWCFVCITYCFVGIGHKWLQ